MPSGSEASWRVLIVPLVYNGEEFVGPCLSSLARMEPGGHVVDILVLDDASTTPGWSDRCREMTTDLGLEYYRTPRNLGIPRNMNLGMQRAVSAAYDAVVIMSAETIVPSNLIPALIRPLVEGRSVSCTSAWSSNSGVYSIPNADPDRLAENPDTVDWVSERLNEEFNGSSVPIPSGAGSCVAFPTTKIDDIGLMDPVFSSIDSAVIDWCLRSHAMGYQSVLAPSCFYCAGHGASTGKSLIGGSDRTDHIRQTITEERFPSYASQLTEFTASKIIDGLRERGLNRIVTSAARQYGYRLEASRLRQRPGEVDLVRFRIDPDGVTPMIMASYQGFEIPIAVGEHGILPTVESIVGQQPREIRIFDRGPVSRQIEAEVGTSGTISLQRSPYPEGVF
jgi:GT2 family glycosyltransferase